MKFIIIIFFIALFSSCKSYYDSIDAKYGFNHLTVVKNYPEDGFYTIIQSKRGHSHLSITKKLEEKDNVLLKNIYEGELSFKVYTKQDSLLYIEFTDESLDFINIPYYVVVNNLDTLFNSEIHEYNFQENDKINSLKIYPYNLTNEFIELDNVNNHIVFISLHTKVKLSQRKGLIDYSFRSFEIDNTEVLDNDTLLITKIFGVHAQNISFNKRSSLEMRRLTKGWVKR